MFLCHWLIGKTKVCLGMCWRYWNEWFKLYVFFSFFLHHTLLKPKDSKHLRKIQFKIVIVLYKICCVQILFYILKTHLTQESKYNLFRQFNGAPKFKLNVLTLYRFNIYKFQTKMTVWILKLHDHNKCRANTV